MSRARSQSERVAAKGAHLTPIEWRFARELGCSPSDIEGPPVAMLVGEAPSTNGQGREPLAMFPWPPTSAAGRLLKISGMPAGVFLGRFHRRNLYPELPEQWMKGVAAGWAEQLRLDARTRDIKRIVLLGKRVLEAFGLDRFFLRREIGYRDLGVTPMLQEDVVVTTLTIVGLPHPSGLNPMYNDPDTCAAARHELMWAAGLT